MARKDKKEVIALMDIEERFQTKDVEDSFNLGSLVIEYV